MKASLARARRRDASTRQARAEQLKMNNAARSWFSTFALAEHPFPRNQAKCAYFLHAFPAILNTRW